jgi:hypothetical protein
VKEIIRAVLEEQNLGKKFDHLTEKIDKVILMRSSKTVLYLLTMQHSKCCLEKLADDPTNSRAICFANMPTLHVQSITIILGLLEDEAQES